jgi:hypothetical protein
VYAWAASAWRPFTLPEEAATALPILALVLLVWRWPPAPGFPEPRRPGAWVWAGLFVALTAWELVALAGSPREDHPTVSYLTDRVMSVHPGRALVFVLWLAAGWWLAQTAARVSRR